MSVVAIYPGTFDPITFGHLDIIRRVNKIFSKIIVGVAADTNKSLLFSLDERVDLVSKVIQEGEMLNVSVIPFQGLLVDFAKSQNARVIIRGLRAVSDFEYEFRMSYMNHQLRRDIETIFLPATERGHFISSTFVKQIAKLNGNLKDFVPNVVAKSLRKRYTT